MGQIVRVNKLGDKNHDKIGEIQGFLLWRLTPTYCVRIEDANYEYSAPDLEPVDESEACCEPA